MFESSNFDIRLSDACLYMASGRAALSRVIVLPGDFRSGAWTGKTAKGIRTQFVAPPSADPHYLYFECVGRPFDFIEETMTKDWGGLRANLDKDIASAGVIWGTFSRYIPRTTAETVIEANYRIALTGSLSITPDVQYVIRPSGSSAIKNAFVLGTQLAIVF